MSRLSSQDRYVQGWFYPVRSVQGTVLGVEVIQTDIEEGRDPCYMGRVKSGGRLLA